MSRKKYLFVIPSLSKGGAERVVSILASELIEQQKEAVVITHFKVENEYLVDSGVKVICLSDLQESEYRAKMSPLYLLKLAKRLRKVIYKENPDYIIPFLWTTCVRVDIALIGSKYKKRVIQTVRNNPYIFPKNNIMKKYRDYLVKKSYLTIVQNEKQKKYFSTYLHKKIRVLPNPVSKELFSIKHNPSKNQINIVGVGRLEKQKNFLLLIEAFEMVWNKNKEVRLHIYGEGTLREQLQEEIDKKRLSQVAILHGRSNSYEEMYGKSSIFVLSSDFEGMPNTLLEAMAVGVPSISTNCPTGPSDIIIDKENGYLVEVGDVNKLYKKMILLIEDGIKSNKISKNARKSILDTYSQAVITSQLINYCEIK